MTEKKSPPASPGPAKKVGSVKLEPLQGQAFDIVPAKSGNKKPVIGRKSTFFSFAVIAVLAFLGLNLGNAYVQGMELVEEGKESVDIAYENIKQGMDSLKNQDGKTASESFARAEEAFSQLTESVRHLTLQANQFNSQNLYLDTAGALLGSALEVTEIGKKLSLLLEEMRAFPGLLLSADENFEMMDYVYQKQAEISELRGQAAALQRKLTGVNVELLPDNAKGMIQLAQHQIGIFIAALLEIESNFDVMLTMLGDEVPHHYLILFQNNHERRATGGFIGSYMLVDVNDGRITKMESKDVYETDGQLADVIKAPAGIDRVANRLYMRDANYGPDFPTSAEQILWFMEHGKGPSADTVIALDQTLVEGLIGLVGPLVIDSIPYQITEDNFTDIVSYHTEAKITESSTPKQLLFDLIPALKKKLGNLDDLGALLSYMKDMVQQGHLQVYSKDAGIQSISRRFGVSGEIVKPEEKTDYLSVITTSIGGNKSDQYMTMNLQHDTQALEDGVLTDRLTIQKRHNWGQEEETKLANMIEQFGVGQSDEESLYFILGRGPNVDYMRVYVPKGSQIQSVEGMELRDVAVSEDAGYTVFGFTIGPVHPGETEEVQLSYRLPYTLDLSTEDSYRFIAQNQAGSEGVTLKKSLQPSEGLSVVESFPETDPADNDGLVFESAFDRNLISITSLVRK
jgi:hypothetical protein